jgi:hypothetical protein
MTYEEARNNRAPFDPFGIIFWSPEKPSLYWDNFKNNGRTMGNALRPIGEGALYVLQEGLRGYGCTVQRIPGRVQSRINIRNGDPNKTGSGLRYAWRKHGGAGTANKSQFSITQDELMAILKRKDVIKSPVNYDPVSGNYIREVDVGQIVGHLPLNRGGNATPNLTVITDRFRNLVNTFPGTLGFGG